MRFKSKILVRKKIKNSSIIESDTDFRKLANWNWNKIFLRIQRYYVETNEISSVSSKLVNIVTKRKFFFFFF